MTVRQALAALALLASPAVARADAPAHHTPSLGIGIDPLEMLSVVFTNAIANASRNGSSSQALLTPLTLYVPIDLEPSIRIEPMFQYGRLGTSTSSTSGNVASSRDAATTSLAVALGGFYRFAGPESALQPFLGGRIGVQQASTSSTTFTNGKETSASGSRIATTFSAVLGADYFFGGRFAIGPEVQFGVTHLGTPTSTDSSGDTAPPSGTSTATVLTTAAGVRMRAFFF